MNPEIPVAKLAVALDLPDKHLAAALVAMTVPHAQVFKVGLELFTREGPSVFKALSAETSLDFEIFLDLKLHDIPETVGRTIERINDMPVNYITVHASGGPAMLERAAKEARKDLKILAVTTLTSLDLPDLQLLGFATSSVTDQALHLARMARKEVPDIGFIAPVSVCRAFRVFPELASAFIATPGIRLLDGKRPPDDQKNVDTPSRAVTSGSDMLVVGRPISGAENPKEAAAWFNEVILNSTVTSVIPKR